VSDEVPGLIAEAESKTRLKEKLAVLVPELLELNSYPFDPRKPTEIAIKYNRAEDRHEERIYLPQVVWHVIGAWQATQIVSKKFCGSQLSI
jgi:hypothetical protein